MHESPQPDQPGISKTRRLLGSAPRTRSVIAATGLLVICVAPFASARTGGPLREGVRNGTTTSETQVISNIASTNRATGGYSTRQSNLSTSGGGAVYGCRSKAGGSAATPAAEPMHPREQPLDRLRVRVQRLGRPDRRPDLGRYRRGHEEAVRDERDRRCDGSERRPGRRPGRGGDHRGGAGQDRAGRGHARRQGPDRRAGAFAHGHGQRRPHRRRAAVPTNGDRLPGGHRRLHRHLHRRPSVPAHLGDDHRPDARRDHRHADAWRPTRRSRRSRCARANSAGGNATRSPVPPDASTAETREPPRRLEGAPAGAPSSL